MSELTSVFSDIATSIRSKLDVNDTMKPGQMSGYIDSIPKPLKSDTPVYTSVVQNISDDVNADNLFANNTNDVMSYPAITFGSTVVSVNNTFFNCPSFNAPVYFDSPSNIRTMDNTFAKCNYFNQPLTVPMGVESMNYTFANCYNFNSPLTIPSSVKSMNNTFYNAYNYYGFPTFSEGLETMDNVFTDARYMWGAPAKPFFFYKIPSTVKSLNQNSLYSFIHEPFVKFSDNLTYFGVNKIFAEVSDNYEGFNWNQTYDSSPFASGALMANSLPNFTVNTDFSEYRGNYYFRTPIILRNPQPFMDRINEAFPGCVWTEYSQNITLSNGANVEAYRYKYFTYGNDNLNIVALNLYTAPNILYVNNPNHPTSLKDNEYDNIFKTVIGKNCEGKQVPFNTMFPTMSYAEYSDFAKFAYRPIIAVEFEEGMKNLSHMFENAYQYMGLNSGSYNLYFVVPNGVTNVSYMFRNMNYGIWNSSWSGAGYERSYRWYPMIVLPNTVEDMSYLYSGYSYSDRYNYPRVVGGNFIIPDSVKNISHAFENVTSFNLARITLGNGIIDGSYAFCNANHNYYNWNVMLPSSLENGCRMFNLNYYTNNVYVSMPSNSKLKDMSYMFTGFKNLNTMDGIFIPNTAFNVSGVFQGTNFNKPLTLSSNVKDASRMLYECSFFNQPITFSEGIENLSYAMHYCSNFNQPVVIPASAKDTSQMLQSCYNFNSSVTFEGYPENTYGMFRSISNDITDRIVFNNLEACTNDAGGIMVGYGYSINLPKTFKALSYTFAETGPNVNVNLAEFENLESLNYTFRYSQCNFENGITIPEGVTSMVETFANSSINHEVVLPESVVNISGLFMGTQNFNYPVTIPNNVKDASNLFFGTSNFNQPITLPNGLINAANMFQQTGKFNQNVNVPESVTDISGMFGGCWGFNAIVNLSNGITDISEMFTSCYNFNKPFTIPETVENCANLFYYCYNYNQPITIPSSVRNTSYMLGGCYNYNQPITIGDNVIDCENMFYDCQNFNQPVTIPENVAMMNDMFRQCYEFNSPVTILNTSIENMCRLFESTSFNQPFTIPESVKDISGLFNCTPFSQALVIPNNVERCDYLLSSNFENSLVIGTNVAYMNYLFYGYDGGQSFVTDITSYATGIKWAEYAFSGLGEWEGGMTFNANNLWGNGMFAGCQFADNITINGDIASSSGMFHSCGSLTEVHLSGNCGNGYYNEGSNEYGNYSEYYGDCSYMFANCLMFNGSLDNVTFLGNCAYMFAGATRFSKPLNLYYAKNTANLFQMSGHYESLPAGIFNAPVVLSNQGDCDMHSMFASCSRFNQPVTIPSNAFQYDNTNSEDYSAQNSYAAYMFADSRFNATLTIENGPKYLSYLLAYSNFNQPVVIPDSVEDVRGMFYGAQQFNQPVTIGNGVQKLADMFYDANKFNSPITFGEGITTLNGIFRYSNYNCPVNIPSSVKDTTNMFSYSSYNQPVNIPEGVEVTVNMFANMYGFNQPVNIPSTVTNTSYMFMGSYDFNQSVNLSGNSTNAAYMFEYCYNFNSPINISNISDASGMFSGCSNFNQPVNIDMGYCNSIRAMFYNCVNLAQPVNITVNNCNMTSGLVYNTNVEELSITGNNLNLYGVLYGSKANLTINGSDILTYQIANYSSYSSSTPNSVTFAPECTNINACDMFSNYTGFNSPVITDGVQFLDCTNMFYNCQNFNQPVNLSGLSGSASQMFHNCQNFNQPVNIINATNCYNMFYRCTNFNQPIVIGDNVDTTWILYNCTNFNSPVTFGNNCRIWAPFEVSIFNSDIRIKGLNTNCSWLVYNCNSFGANIYIDWIGNNAALVNCISSNTNALQKSFHVTSEATDFMLNQYLVYAGSQVKPTYEALGDGNGYFNAAYNIYIYNNYIPA